jgi:hypothetical protein
MATLETINVAIVAVELPRKRVHGNYAKNSSRMVFI